MDKMWGAGERDPGVPRDRDLDYAAQKQRNREPGVIQPLALFSGEYYFYLAAFIQNIDEKGNLTTQTSIPHHLPPGPDQTCGDGRAFQEFRTRTGLRRKRIPQSGSRIHVRRPGAHREEASIPGRRWEAVLDRPPHR